MTIVLFFFFNDTATTEIYTLSLHDALPISHLVPDHRPDGAVVHRGVGVGIEERRLQDGRGKHDLVVRGVVVGVEDRKSTRLNSSRLHLVCRLLLEQKKTITSALLV